MSTRKHAPLAWALTACSWLPARHPLYRASLASLRSSWAAASETSAVLADMLGVTPRHARRILATYGLRRGGQ